MSLNELLQQCDKNTLVGVVRKLCAMFQEVYLDEPDEHNGFLRSRDVRGVVCSALIKMKVAEQRHQKEERNALAVVCGAHGRFSGGGQPKSHCRSCEQAYC